MIRLKHILYELSYEGSVGVMELVDFYDKATPAQKKAFELMMKTKSLRKAWELVQKVTGTNLQGSA